MEIKLNFIPTELFMQYCLNINNNVEQHFQSLHDSELSMESFSFYTSVAAVFSSKIEGENIELDSCLKHKRFGAPSESAKHSF